MQNDWINESGIALSAVSEAAEFLSDDIKISNVSTKETLRDIVTDIDLKIQNSILQKLSSSQYTVISEENLEGKPIIDLSNSTNWIVDPLDGTVNYLNGIPLYAVGIALCDRGEFVVGAIALPALNEIYFTYGSKDAYYNGKKLKPCIGLSKPVSQSLFVCAFSGNKIKSKERQLEYEIFGEVNDSSRGCLRIGSAITSLCFVISNRVDCAFGLNVKIWDISAAIAIAKKAGFSVLMSSVNSKYEVSFIVGKSECVQHVFELMRQKGLENIFK
jgi:myo-inositol-1(or 4)-monophosphatase